MTLGTAEHRGAVSIVDGTLYALGDGIPLDGRVSWAPSDATGYQRINAYLVVADGSATLVDTGIAAHRERILSQLRELVPENAALSAFLTRAEYECVGNLGAIAESFDIAAVYTGGFQNPFDAFDVAESFDRDRARPEHVQMERAATRKLVSEKTIEVFSPPLRLLAAFWGYEPTTRTLFTSDVFGHCWQTSPAAPAVVDSPALDTLDPADMAEHVYAKFPWLRGHEMPTMAADLRQVFAERPVETIAPTHGCMLRGSEVVTRHVELLHDILSGGTGNGVAATGEQRA